jgi:tagaturonate reductase
MSVGTILQFGAGNFLRAFVDLFVQQARDAGQPVGRVIVVQSTQSGRAAALAGNGGRYHVLLRGLRAGKVVDELHPVDVIELAINANTDWSDLLSLARSPEVTHVVSNTTEAGFALVDTDQFDATPPSSFPGKLTRLLAARCEAGLPGWTVLPCELIEGNGPKLRDLVLEQARRWGLSDGFLQYVTSDCQFASTLVDRIVTGKPASQAGLPDDPLLTAAEPFAFWAIEAGGANAAARPLEMFNHPAIQFVGDLLPYSLRKIRLLNGAHTALVCHALPRGFVTVRQALEDRDEARWLKKLLDTEIVPVLQGRVEDPEGYARETLERFANPFLNHRLTDIALNHPAKLKTRLLSTWRDYRNQFGSEPEELTTLLKSAVETGDLAAGELTANACAS